MSKEVHIYTAKEQPAVRYKVDGVGVVKSKPRSLAYCCTCGRRRQLRNMRVRTYFDTVYFYCSIPCKRR